MQVETEMLTAARGRVPNMGITKEWAMEKTMVN
jgi:hypothetical protein